MDGSQFFLIFTVAILHETILHETIYVLCCAVLLCDMLWNVLYIMLCNMHAVGYAVCYAMLCYVRYALGYAMR